MSFIQRTVPVGRLQCNCQILVCPKTREAVIVDPGDEANLILSNLKSIEKHTGAPVRVKALFHTHAHFDHIGATRKVKETLMANGIDAPQIYLHKADEFLYGILEKQSAMFGFVNGDPLPVDHFFQDEQTFQFGTMKFTALHTPGHSPGGMCFRLHEDTETKIPETVFTGDTLFREDIGRADLWGGDEATLVKSIRERILVLDGDTLAWPGHGPITSVGHEKLKNPHI